MDQLGRVWSTSQVRGVDNPAFCKPGSDNPYAKNFPMERSTRQASVFDPKTGQMTAVDTCFSTHHLQFAEDKDNTLVLLGRQQRHRLDQYARMGRNPRPGQGPGLVSDGGGYERGRRDRRLHGAEPAPRPTERHARRRVPLRHHRQPGRRVGVVGDGGCARPHRAARDRDQSAGDVPDRDLRAARSIRTIRRGSPIPRAASTSRARASSGRACRAARISAASIAASARSSTVRRRPARSAHRAGPSIRRPVRR